MIHDIEPKHLYNEWKPNAVPKRSSAVVQFCGRNLLCRIDDNGLKLPSRAMFPDGDERFTYLFELDGREYYLLRDETPRGPARGTCAAGTATRGSAAAAARRSSTTSTSA